MIKIFSTYNIQLDSDKKALIGNGSDSSHLNIICTSKKLISNIELNGVHHIDGTYKIITYGFPLVIQWRNEKLFLR